MTITVVPGKNIGATLSICFPYDEDTVATQQRLINRILKRFGGQITASGVALSGAHAGTRGVECEVRHTGRQQACLSALRDAGFHAEEIEDVIVEEIDGIITIRSRAPGP